MAASTAAAAGLPSSTRLTMSSPRPGSLAIMASAWSTPLASAAALSATRSRSRATASRAATTLARSVSGSTVTVTVAWMPTGWSWVSGMRTTGPTARPALTPRPTSGSGIVGVEVAGHQRRELVQGLVGPVAFGGQDDHFPTADVHAKHGEDAAFVDRWLALLAESHLDRLLGSGLDENGGRTSMQSDSGPDRDTSLCHC